MISTGGMCCAAYHTIRNKKKKGFLFWHSGKYYTLLHSLSFPSLNCNWFYYTARTAAEKKGMRIWGGEWGLYAHGFKGRYYTQREEIQDSHTLYALVLVVVLKKSGFSAKSQHRLYYMHFLHNIFSTYATLHICGSLHTEIVIYTIAEKVSSLEKMPQARPHVAFTWWIKRIDFCTSLMTPVNE